MGGGAMWCCGERTWKDNVTSNHHWVQFGDPWYCWVGCIYSIEDWEYTWCIDEMEYVIWVFGRILCNHCWAHDFQVSKVAFSVHKKECIVCLLVRNTWTTPKPCSPTLPVSLVAGMVGVNDVRKIKNAPWFLLWERKRNNKKINLKWTSTNM